ncbi:DNA phosphorothioation system restriction enzyme [Halothece sp. PCC 7418]|uniref:DNA phosphorothioation system restriction enzyme n=1 Tax=Halothece sp. (strain PCC 7418) TaxID=65093 RepID=UPI001C0A90FC|nr:DNA phosphorothioation system restriction enzyme [Halothece sp. PCC 7418]
MSQIQTTIHWEILAQNYEQSHRRQGNLREKPRGYHFQRLGSPRLPSDLVLRDYQTQAVVSWFRQRGRGMLKMATGSGKTITALAITTELHEKIGLQALLVVCPYRHLVTQWARECGKFNLQPLLAFESVEQWQRTLSNQLYHLTKGTQDFLTIITTKATLIKEGFQSQLPYFPEKTLIVGDEAHHLGTPRLLASLPSQIGLRLGLSATPERYFDETGTDGVFHYFGATLSPQFTLADAIAQGALVPYFYYPLFVELTAAEALTYAKFTKRIGWALADNPNWNTNETLTSLLMQRSRLVGTAENKLPTLARLMSTRLDTSHTLFYCGDGAIETRSDGIHRQVAAVTRLLGNELGFRVHSYTAETPMKEREQLRIQFEQGELQGLVAIHCLDEGVDIPAIRHAVILASTGNPRQFIQRRGRVLRPHSGKTEATIFDMIAIPPQLDRETWEVERNLLRKELKRFLEFAKLAKNAAAASEKLLTLQEQYRLPPD